MIFELRPFELPADYGEDIVPLEDIRAHVGLVADETEFDDLLAALRDSAVDMVERRCGVRLGVCTGLEWTADALPARLRVGVWPVLAVTAISWLDRTGAVVTGDPAIFRIGVRDELRLKPGQVLPSGVAEGVTITFTAGFDTGNCPRALVQAVKMFTAHLFANREAVATGTISGEIPLGFRTLCDAYRMPVI